MAAVTGLATWGLMTPLQANRSVLAGPAERKFTYCLNTSTVSGCGDFSVLDYLAIAAESGYDGVELWMGDIRKFLSNGGTKAAIRTALETYELTFENTIGFAPWLAGDTGLATMREEMELLAELGAKRVAAPPMGHDAAQAVDWFQLGQQYKKLLAIGRETGVMPQLEFWGASPVFWHLGQGLMALAATAEADARLLPDIYHLFRGGTDFAALSLLNPAYVEVFHLNDFLADKPRLEQSDADRVFPGDGVAPITEVLRYLAEAPGHCVLSLELFNRAYWERPALEVAQEGLAKMQQVVKVALG